MRGPHNFELVSTKDAAKVKRLWRDFNYSMEEIAKLANLNKENVVEIVNGRLHPEVPPSAF